MQQTGNVMGLVEQIMIIIGITRGKHLIPDLFPIDLRLIHSQCRDSQYRFSGRNMWDVLFKYFYGSFSIWPLCCDKMLF